MTRDRIELAFWAMKRVREASLGENPQLTIEELDAVAEIKSLSMGGGLCPPGASISVRKPNLSPEQTESLTVENIIRKAQLKADYHREYRLCGLCGFLSQKWKVRAPYGYVCDDEAACDERFISARETEACQAANEAERKIKFFTRLLKEKKAELKFLAKSSARDMQRRDRRRIADNHRRSMNRIAKL